MGKGAKLHQPLPWAPHTHSSPHSHYHLHHFISPTPPHVPYPHPQLWKNCLPQHWPLVPKRLGSKTVLCGLLQSLTNLHLLSEQNYGSINKKKRKICINFYLSMGCFMRPLKMSITQVMLQCFYRQVHIFLILNSCSFHVLTPHA